MARSSVTIPAMTVLLALVAAGCSDAEADESGPSLAPGQTTIAVESLELVPPAEAPEPPPELQEPTEEGAIALAEYWFDGLNYSLANNDVELLEGWTAGSCPQCNAWFIIIGENASAGNVMDGGFTYPVRLAIGPFSTREPVTFAATFVSTAATITRPDGTADAYPRLEGDGFFSVVWSEESGRWLMADVQLPQPSS